MHIKSCSNKKQLTATNKVDLDNYNLLHAVFILEIGNRQEHIKFANVRLCIYV